LPSVDDEGCAGVTLWGRARVDDLRACVDRRRAASVDHLSG
jgi:hypothetical protein